MKAVIVLVALLTAACSGSNPSAPTPPPIQPSPITLTVHVTGTGSGQPLVGVSGELGGISGVTNGDGGLQLQTQPGASQRLSLTGAGIVPRSVMLAVTGSREVSVDAIPTAGFDLNFYRQIVRNGFEAPAALQPLRRWTEAPRIYLRTVRDDGAAVDPAMLNTTEQVVRESIPTWSVFQPATIERGTDTRVGQAGWLTVRWPGVVGADRVCGKADVGLSGGAIDLYVPTIGACGCNGTARIRPRTIRHELGHAMGFYHTDSQTDLMFVSSSSCDVQPSARERAAAAIAYARPVGNADPDQDPASVVTLAPMRVP